MIPQAIEILSLNAITAAVAQKTKLKGQVEQ